MIRARMNRSLAEKLKRFQQFSRRASPLWRIFRSAYNYRKGASRRDFPYNPGLANLKEANDAY